MIGFTRNGISYIRGLMTSHTDANTLAQQEQRAKFSLVIHFLQPLLALVRMGFKKAGTNLSGFNSAVAYTLGNAVKGIYPALEIDYNKVLVCQGNLEGALNGAASSLVAAKIDFTWDNNSSELGAKATDKVVLVAYCPVLKKVASFIGDATRATGSQTVTLPDLFSGQQVHTYMGFCNAAQTEFSKGEFLQTIAVA